MRHAVVANEALPAVTCNVRTATDGTLVRGMQRYLLGQGILEMFITQMLEEGVAGCKHQLTKGTLDLQCLVGHHLLRLLFGHLELLLAGVNAVNHFQILLLRGQHLDWLLLLMMLLLRLL